MLTLILILFGHLGNQGSLMALFSYLCSLLSPCDHSWGPQRHCELYRSSGIHLKEKVHLR